MGSQRLGHGLKWHNTAKIGVRKTYRGNYPPCHLLQQEDVNDSNRKKSVMHLSGKRGALYSSEESGDTLLAWQERGRLPSHSATSPANGKCCSSANEKSPSPESLISSSEHPCFLSWWLYFLVHFSLLEKLSCCIIPQSMRVPKDISEKFIALIFLVASNWK